MTSQIFDYNHTKAGVDTLDQMCRMYSARSTTKRWPLVHFQNLLDVAGINAQTVFDEAHPSWSNIRRKDRRRFFLKQLANQLAREHMTERLRKKSGLQKSTISALESYVGQTEDISHLQPQLSLEKSRCALCKAEGKQTRNCNLTKLRCQNCGKWACEKHSSAVVLCRECE